MAEVSYYLLVAQLNRFGAQTRRCALAVAITKADLLAAKGGKPAPHATEASSHLLKAWLRNVGLRNIVETAEQDFNEVRYFLVGDNAESTDWVAPFTWLLTRYRHGAAIP
jgi:hypothetical protein